MKVIKFIDESGRTKVFNPIYITSVELVYDDYHNNWCVVMHCCSSKVGDVFTKIYDTKESAEEAYAYIISCMESISSEK